MSEFDSVTFYNFLKTVSDTLKKLLLQKTSIDFGVAKECLLFFLVDKRKMQTSNYSRSFRY